MTSADSAIVAAEGYLAAKAAAVRAERRRAVPTDAEQDALRAAAIATRQAPSFAAALAGGDNVALIAEFKRRSPSGGRMPGVGEPGNDAPAEAASVASDYVACGARAVSVLTDAADFDGALDDLAAAAARVNAPVLRKDFILDEAALYEARCAGAAAALLITGILSPAELRGLLDAAREVALQCLVEVHDERELEAALDAGARIIGINNRDLRRLTTDPAVTVRLAPLVPAGRLIVSESGIRTADDVARVRDAGAHAVLVGEALLRVQGAPREELVRALSGVSRNPSVAG